MKTPVVEKATLSNKEYAALTAQSVNYRVILRLLKASGLDAFLQNKKLPPIDLSVTPDDMMGGDSICLFLKALADECSQMDAKIQTLSEALVDANLQLAKMKRKTAPKKSFNEVAKELFKFK